MRRLTALTLSVPLVLGLSACSDAESAADAAVDRLDAEATTAAMERFSDFQDQVGELTSYRAHGTVHADDGTQHAELEFDRDKDAFAGDVSLDSGSLEMTLEIVRASRLLWIRGPEEYWEAFGYNAAPAIGKYVVFEATAGDTVADGYDYDKLLTTVETIGAGEVAVEGKVDADGAEFLRFALGHEDRSALLDIPATGELDQATLISRVDDVEATIVIDDFDTVVDIAPPDPAEVTQP